MRAVFLAENYHRFYDRYWAEHPELQALDHDAIQRRMFAEFFYHSDSAAAALRELGHEAHTLIPDCIPLQVHWAREHGVWMPPYPNRKLKFLDRLCRYATGNSLRSSWHARILSAQLRHYRPDVVQVFSGVRMTAPMLQRLRPRARKWVCQWACPLLEHYPFASYDLILTTATNFVEEFTRRGLACRMIQHAFDERIVPHLESAQPQAGAVFIGSITSHHRQRIAMLEAIVRRVPVDIYGEGFESLPADSPVRAAWRGSSVFGLAMYRLYARYRIALHIPGDAGRAHAGAKRLFEITGTGTLLLAEAQPGLEDYFALGREIDVFGNAEEAAAKIHYYSAHDPARQAMAAAGQQRTLRDHVYRERMKEWLHAVGNP